MAWKQILCDGWFPDYVVNEYGIIVRKKDGIVMRKYIQKSGYEAVYLKSTSGETCARMVHRIVAIAFLPQPQGKNVVDHINTIRCDNRVCNLRWVTQKENMNNPITKRRLKRRRKQNGDKS